MQKPSFLVKPVSSSLLGLFRIFFGLCLIYELIYYVDIDLLNRGLRQTAMLFPYKGLEWIKLLPGKGMEVLMILLFASAVCITLGWKLRQAAIVFFAGFSYIFFIDKALYNNHLYLFVLLAFLLVITDSDAAYSVSKKRHRPFLPAWQLWILRFQLIVVYFYGGLAKLNPDWLVHLQPAKVMLDASHNNFQLYILVYGGLVFDLCIGFLLLWKRTRNYAMVAAIIFNITNSIIFKDIGIFPFFMIGSLLLFFDADMPLKWFPARASVPKKGKKETTKISVNEPLPQPMMLFLFAYVIFQLLFPLRHLLYKGNTDWYCEAQRFSWRMKIQQRELTDFKITVLDYQTKRMMTLDPVKYITYAQLIALKTDPAMVLSLVKFVEKDAHSKGIADPFIKVTCQVTFNGRPAQDMVDPERNLCLVTEDEPVQKWVLPLKNP